MSIRARSWKLELQQNVHIRHLPAMPHMLVYDTPSRVEVRTLDRRSGATRMIGRFGGHYPAHGPFRCDLYPVPGHRGDKVVVTSLHDGGRQLYLLERQEAQS